LRGFRKNPTFTAVAVASLALGIGLNTAIFNLVSAVLLQPLPVRDPARLVSVFTSDRINPGLLYCSYPNYKDYRDLNQVFTGLVLYSGIGVGLTDSGEPQPAPAEPPAPSTSEAPPAVEPPTEPPSASEPTAPSAPIEPPPAPERIAPESEQTHHAAEEPSPGSETKHPGQSAGGVPQAACEGPGCEVPAVVSQASDSAQRASREAPAAEVPPEVAPSIGSSGAATKTDSSSTVTSESPLTWWPLTTHSARAGNGA